MWTNITCPGCQCCHKLYQYQAKAHKSTLLMVPPETIRPDESLDTDSRTNAKMGISATQSHTPLNWAANADTP